MILFSNLVRQGLMNYIAFCGGNKDIVIVKECGGFIAIYQSSSLLSYFPALFR
jgi:hypothetical protein